MLNSLLVISLAVSGSFALVPFNSYREVCENNLNCYALFNDLSHISKGANYQIIEAWPRIEPYSDPSSNIGFAQSHAQALSYRLWLSKPSDSIQNSVFSETSVLKAASTLDSPACKSPSSPNGDNLPFDPLGEEEPRFYLKQAFPYSTNPRNWCNPEFLNSLNNTGATGYKFPGYEFKMLASSMTFEKIKSDLQTKGIGLITIPHDYSMANGFGYYNHGYYTLSGQWLYSYPANVVGVQKTESGEVLLLVYAFGAHHPDTNYLWVKLSEITSSDSIAYIRNFEF